MILHRSIMCNFKSSPWISDVQPQCYTFAYWLICAGTKPYFGASRRTYPSPDWTDRVGWNADPPSCGCVSEMTLAPARQQEQSRTMSSQPPKDFLALTHGHEWVNFYELFDQLVQDHLSRSSELLQKAMSLPDVADREVAELRETLELQLKTERTQANETLTTLRAEISKHNSRLFRSLPWQPSWLRIWKSFPIGSMVPGWSDQLRSRYCGFAGSSPTPMMSRWV